MILIEHHWIGPTTDVLHQIWIKRLRQTLVSQKSKINIWCHRVDADTSRASKSIEANVFWFNRKKIDFFAWRNLKDKSSDADSCVRTLELLTHDCRLKWCQSGAQQLNLAAAAAAAGRGRRQTNVIQSNKDVLLTFDFDLTQKQKANSDFESRFSNAMIIS